MLSRVNLVGIFLLCIFGCLTAGHVGKRLIKTSDDTPAKWLTPQEIHGLLDAPDFECPWKVRNHFVDITSNPGFSLKDAPKTVIPAIPDNPRYQAKVNAMISTIPRYESDLQETVRHLSEEYHTRYYNSSGGAASAKWLYDEVVQILSAYQGESSVREVDHGFKQKSVIASLHGAGSEESTDRVILGAHIDSATFEDFLGPHNNSRAPGADSDATGCAVLLATLRIMVESGTVPIRPLEFHWYAGEEMGLLGSMEIARAYRIADVGVAAMLQFDRVGYRGPNGSDIGIYTDDVNPELTGFVRLLTDEYLQFGWRNNTCGYACSDHVSWAGQGYAAAFVSDASYPYSDIGCQHHFTSNDTIAMVDFAQVKEMVKIGVAFAVELPGTLS